MKAEKHMVWSEAKRDAAISKGLAGAKLNDEEKRELPKDAAIAGETGRQAKLALERQG